MTIHGMCEGGREKGYKMPSMWLVFCKLHITIHCVCVLAGGEGGYKKETLQSIWLVLYRLHMTVHCVCWGGGWGDGGYKKENLPSMPLVSKDFLNTIS